MTRPDAYRRGLTLARAVATGLVMATIGSLALRPPEPGGWLGITLSDGATAAGGAARVETILPDSPAQQIGLRAGDLVRAASGRRTERARDLVRLVRRSSPGTVLSLTIVRDGGELVIPATLATRPAEVYRLLERDRDAWQQPERVLDLLAPRPGATIVDLGAGGGYFTEQLATRVGPEGRVIAIDIDPDALEQLTARFPHARYPQVFVRRGGSSDPGLAPQTVDGVLFVDTYHEIVDAPAMLRALRRALRPSGRLVVVDRPAAVVSHPGTHAIAEAQVVDEMARAGFRRRARADLPRQFAVAFD